MQIHVLLAGASGPGAGMGRLECPTSFPGSMVSYQACTEILQKFNLQFVRRTNEEDYIDILSDQGCYSYVGRIGGGQVLSLERNGCVFHHIIQHELLHALGFHHEQDRSDRDDHVRILLQNVIPGEEHNFDKVSTNNLNTPYDYNSVMHYSRFAFSRNQEPTILPIPDNNVPIGCATEMSPNDILRVNRLYCS
ncbi:hypothetical protein QTP70_019379 [Hemibagrus guttatus]|uniref:Metalloendopeptidase n=1 Tax=Hemibagrus guttatus TaxID=175788 RepID=A0AAE0UL66_9TELE|nr:hypothetical protein QTP70_019379 [Hemibagrus guttatus]